MKRLVVLVMLLALPVRTVLAVSGIACSMPPMQPSSAHSHAPCQMHATEADVNLALAETQPESGDGRGSCPSCAAVCCAALAPASSSISPVALVGDHVSAVLSLSYSNAVVHSLERPPRGI